MTASVPTPSELPRGSGTLPHVSPPMEPEGGPSAPPINIPDSSPEAPRQEGLPEDTRTAPSPQPSARAEPPIPTAPEPTVTPEGEGLSSRRASILDDGRFAEGVLGQALRPEYRQELIGMGANSFFREIYASLAQAANSVGVLREVLAEAKEEFKSTCQELEVARLEASTAREEAGKAREEAKKAQEEAEKAREEAERAMIQVMEVTAALEEEKKKGAEDLQVAFDRAETEAARARAAISQMCQVEGKMNAQDRRVAELSQALEESEVGRMRESARAEGLQARVLALETAAETRASAVIDEFRASKQFEEELAEASADAYVQGFDLGKAQVAEKLGLPAALDVEMELDPPETTEDPADS